MRNPWKRIKRAVLRLSHPHHPNRDREARTLLANGRFGKAAFRLLAVSAGVIGLAVFLCLQPRCKRWFVQLEAWYMRDAKEAMWEERYYLMEYDALYRSCVPCLAAFYSDLRRFPSDQEGWDALFECPQDEPALSRWNGPYVTSFDPAAFRSDLLGQPMEYRSLEDGQAAWIHLRGPDQLSGNDDDIYVSLQRLDEQRDPRPNSRIAWVHAGVVEILNLPLERYAADHGEYPYDLDHLVTPPTDRPTAGYIDERELDSLKSRWGSHTYRLLHDAPLRGFTIMLELPYEGVLGEGYLKRWGNETFTLGNVQLVFLRREDGTFETLIARCSIGKDFELPAATGETK